MTKLVIEVVESFDKIISAFYCWRWIPVKESLPPMFMNVLVDGIDQNHNPCPVARRFTGWSSGWDGISDNKEAPWHWLTPLDHPVKQVKRWMPIPVNGITFHREFERISCVKPENYSIEFSDIIKGINNDRTDNIHTQGQAEDCGPD